MVAAHWRNPEVADHERRPQARAELDAHVAGRRLKELRKAKGKNQPARVSVCGAR